MIDPDLSCNVDKRRDAVRAAPLFGLDYIEVSADQLTLTVFFLGKAPASIQPKNVSIAGGSRIKGIRVTGLRLHRQQDPTLDDSMDVRVNQAGDFSIYTLSVVQLDVSGRPTNQPMQGFDPRFSEVDFTFKGACPTGLDCLPQQVCPPAPRSQPEINYLAKDYASFRQLIFDRLAQIMPAWQETHEPDIGVALVELLAYVGDYLSYYQDAVATEAYLGTARQRISVRRHVRLIDYAMHEGCNARAWVTLWTDSDQGFDDLTQIYFITAYPNAPATQVLSQSNLANVPTSTYEIFQPLLPATGTLSIYQAHSKICFYTWGDDLCCIAPGATSATLVDQWVVPAAQDGAAIAVASDGPAGTVRALHLNVGDILIFEEVAGPKTGNPADADPTHRQAVRLTKVTPTVDALYHPYGPDFGQPIVEIEWSAEDALTFPLCLSVQLPAPDCTILQNVSVARGNVVLVDHGATTSEVLGTVPTESTTANCPSPCHPALVQVSPGWFRPTLKQAPLTFSQPLPAGSASASALIVQDPRQALPNIILASIPAAPAAPTGSSYCVPPLFTFDDLNDPSSLAMRLKQAADVVSQFLKAQLSPGTRTELVAWNGGLPLPVQLRTDLLKDLNATLASWFPVADLLESGASDFSFVVEMDNDGQGHLRFGDGQLGRQPDAGMEFQANYRTGNGTAGNVGAETIEYLVLRNETLSGVNIQPRNPLAATGGTAYEPISEVKLFAPHAFQDVIERAITADDYATLAADNSRRMEQRPARAALTTPFVPLQGAKATLRWTGGWYEALVSINPRSTDNAAPQLLREVRTYLEPYRRMGHDLTVAGANYVPLDLALSVCVLPDYLRAHVEETLLQVFSNGVQPDGSNGFFNPNNLSFGQGIYVSQIVAAAQAVTGVASVSVTRLARYEMLAHPFPAVFGIASGAVPPLGVLTLGPFEIAQLDNDPNYPEHGRLELNLRGGR
jgi:hypothetical protein